MEASEYGGIEMTDVAEQIGLVAFALSAVLVLRGHEVDVVGIVALGVVTAIGGGTVRDLLLEEPVFWVADPSNLLVPAVAALVGFALSGLVTRARRAIELLDGLGLAVFSVAGAAIALEAGARPVIGVILGVITATAGGALRDVLAHQQGRPIGE
ncbi:MAG: TRIC cation channel family protein, partial [Actinomycetota bacterium]